MRAALTTLLAASATLCAGTASGDHWPAVVIPGKAGVPVIFYGYDASYGVVYGDWGLYRPGSVPAAVIYPPNAAPYVEPGRTVPHYFPHSGRRPKVGRDEREPPANRPPPVPAESFHREWGVQSQSLPVTEYAPFDPPSVIVEPTIRDDRVPRPRPRPRPPR
jgi:hypothetical protein